jgi:hypothetical protein
MVIFERGNDAINFHEIQEQLSNYCFASFLLFFMLLGRMVSMAQEEKVVEKVKRNDYKNVAKFNVSSQILYNNALLFGFERVIKPRQSLNISGGYIEFPISLKVPESMSLREQRKKSGYNIALDWRFYLASENKDLAPHGVYLAPFLSIHHFQSDRDFTYTDSTGATKNGTMNNRINFLPSAGNLDTNSSSSAGLLWMQFCLVPVSRIINSMSN